MDKQIKDRLELRYCRSVANWIYVVYAKCKGGNDRSKGMDLHYHFLTQLTCVIYLDKEGGFPFGFAEFL